MAQGAPGNLGPYRLLNVVHTGHACQLWQAYDDAKQRMVARQDPAGEDSTETASSCDFLRWEYAVGQKIKHPHIIEMYAFDWDRGQPYLGHGVVLGAEHEAADPARASTRSPR